MITLIVVVLYLVIAAFTFGSFAQAVQNAAKLDPFFAESLKDAPLTALMGGFLIALFWPLSIIAAIGMVATKEKEDK